MQKADDAQLGRGRCQWFCYPEPVGIEPTRYTLVTEGGYLTSLTLGRHTLQGSCDSTQALKKPTVAVTLILIRSA